MNSWEYQRLFNTPYGYEEEGIISSYIEKIKKRDLILFTGKEFVKVQVLGYDSHRYGYRTFFSLNMKEEGGKKRILSFSRYDYLPNEDLIFNKNGKSVLIASEDKESLQKSIENLSRYNILRVEALRFQLERMESVKVKKEGMIKRIEKSIPEISKSSKEALLNVI